jgi:hypothetical protein
MSFAHFPQERLHKLGSWLLTTEQRPNAAHCEQLTWESTQDEETDEESELLDWVFKVTVVWHKPHETGQYMGIGVLLYVYLKSQ